jgi:hypothetical protein
MYSILSLDENTENEDACFSDYFGQPLAWFLVSSLTALAPRGGYACSCPENMQLDT